MKGELNLDSRNFRASGLAGPPKLSYRATSTFFRREPLFESVSDRIASRSQPCVPIIASTIPSTSRLVLQTTQHSVRRFPNGLSVPA
jgi:hypothetical protein